MKTLTERKAKTSVDYFRMFSEACGTKGNTRLLSAGTHLYGSIGELPSDPFEAANAITVHLLEKGWSYGLEKYRLKDMLSCKAGNCLGLSCLYGAILGAKGFAPSYELVVGPKAFQGRDEQDLLTHLMCGHAFPFHAPLLPERSAPGEKLLFSTMEHPRLILGGKRFETTVLERQRPSQIKGEWVRQLDFKALTGLVCYESSHGARIRHDYEKASEFHKQALELDPDNREIFVERAELAWHMLDDRSFMQAAKEYVDSKANHSKYWLAKYMFFGDLADLDLALLGNPTDMRAWPLKNVICERDAGSQRANLAVAAQCIARSEILNLGDFYAVYSAMLAKLFPNIAVSVVKSSRNSKTDCIDYHLAMALLGSCKGVKWTSKSRPHEHLASLMQCFSFLSPLHKTRVLFAATRLSKCSAEWKSHCKKFAGSKIFQNTLSLLEKQWGQL